MPHTLFFRPPLWPNMSDANIALAQRFFGAFARKDLDDARACLADDVVWRVPGMSVISGEHARAEGVLGYFGRLRELTGGTWAGHPMDLCAGKTGVVVLARGTGERNGRRFDSTYALHLRIDGGKIVEARLYPEDLRAFEAFWS